MTVAFTTIQVPYVDVALQHRALKGQLLAAAAQVIDSGQFILGPQVAQFESAFAALCRVKHAIAVSNGTDALILALRVLDIGVGDEVITVPNSFVASTACIALVGARPVFVDVGDDMNLDPQKLEGAITPRTRAILPVHLTGRPADMDPIVDCARRHGLRIVEDCAQAVLAEYQGQTVRGRVGALGDPGDPGDRGDLGCFSLHPLKTLGALGDGGVITTNDDRMADRLRILRNLGLRTREQCQQWSGNHRLDTLQAAMLLVKLRYLEEWTNARRAHAAFYQTELTGLPQVTVPHDPPRGRSVYHTFVIQADRRDELKAYLDQQGIQTTIHYPIPIHLQDAGRPLGYREGDFPVAEQQCRRILSLPIFPELSHEQIQHVAASIRAFYAALRHGRRNDATDWGCEQ